MLRPVKGSKQAPDRDLLLANHTFPGAYVIKAFGPAEGTFREQIHGCARAVVGERVRVTERASRGGRRICVTLELHAETVDEVIDVYVEVYGVESLMLIL